MSALSLPLDHEQFLADYWQREPLFIAGGFLDFEPPLSADELAGLAMEPHVDARIVSREGAHWQQRQGPFTLEELQRQGSWSLLVQGVDRYSPGAEALLNTLPFLPRWRLDDVLMSYATDGGGAGPHYDQYDVFIVQGTGQRRWDLGQRCDDSTPLLPHPELRLLADFRVQSSHTLSCGDVLYIPPGVAHRGESLGESTSFSIGFRAPSLATLLARWLDNQLETLDAQQLLGDPRREPAVCGGEITRHDLARAQQQLSQLLDFDDPRWFGEALTGRSAALERDQDVDLAAPCTLRVAPGEKLAWMRVDRGLLVFAGGESRPCAQALLPLVDGLGSGGEHRHDPREVTADARELLQWLLDSGTLQEDG